MEHYDIKLMNTTDDAICGRLQLWLNIEFGGVTMFVHPLIKYEKVTRIETKTIRSIAIRVKGLTSTGQYILPIAKEGEGVQSLNRMKTICRERAVIIGYMNAERKIWDTEWNCRGRRTMRWADTHHWNIDASMDLASGLKGRAVNAAGIALTKEVKVHHLKASPTATLKSSNRQRIYLTVGIVSIQAKRLDMIPKMA